MPYKDREKERQTKKKYYQNNKEKIKEYQKEYQANMNQEKKNAYQREYYKNNKDKFSAASKRWLSKNPGYERKYYERHGEARRAYSIKRNAKRRTYLARVKRMFGCYLCGYRACPDALEFHHTSGEKEGNVSMLTRSTIDKLRAEIRKCVVLCANCHREVHAGCTDLAMDGDKIDE